jgi:hypothetical protein
MVVIAIIVFQIAVRFWFLPTMQAFLLVRTQTLPDIFRRVDGPWHKCLSLRITLDIRGA